MSEPFSDIRDSVRREVTRIYVQSFENLAISTTCRLAVGGIWENGDFVYEYVLRPLLASKRCIRLFDYRSRWKEFIPSHQTPNWLPLLDSAATSDPHDKSVKLLAPEAALAPALREFWFSRTLVRATSAMPTQRDVIRLCIPVLEVPLKSYPVVSLRALRGKGYWTTFVINNYFRPLGKSLSSWLRQQRDRCPENLYFVHSDLSKLDATGATETLMDFYDAIIRDVGFPYPSDDTYAPRLGESVVQCATRLTSKKR